MPEGHVSIHAPARGATLPSVRLGKPFSSFNSRARAGRDLDHQTYFRAIRNVSIHAPARGATCVMAYNRCMGHSFQFTRPRGARLRRARRRPLDAVSIHAPARGATPRPRQLVAGLRFQFTRPRGARPLRRPAHLRLQVSIHAPARGATAIRWRLSKIFPSFNSRARAGRDKLTQLITTLI